LQRWTWKVGTQSLFWQDSSGNMLNPVVGLFEFIAEGPGGCGAAGRVAAIEQA
jgi:hypothetical protein